MVGRKARFGSVLRIVVDHELQWIKHGDPPLRAFVEVVAQTILQRSRIDPLVSLGHANALGESANRFRGVSAPSQAGQRRHSRIVPAIDVTTLHELEQLALAHDRVGEVQPGELVLLRQRPLQKAGVGEPFDDPIVERPMVLELKSAQ